jgi:hypothetical protein
MYKQRFSRGLYGLFRNNAIPTKCFGDRPTSLATINFEIAGCQQHFRRIRSIHDVKSVCFSHASAVSTLRGFFSSAYGWRKSLSAPIVVVSNDHFHNSIIQKRKFGAKKKKKKGKKKKKARMSEEEEYLRMVRRKNRGKRNLHPAAKWKRVLSACDYWFSKANLLSDDFLRDKLKRYHGYVPIKVLLTFPKFHGWTDAELLVDAFNSTGGDRYIVKFDPNLWLRDPPVASKKDGSRKTKLDPSPASKTMTQSIPPSLRADDVLLNDDLFSFSFEKKSDSIETDEGSSTLSFDGVAETTAVTAVEVRNATTMNDAKRTGISDDRNRLGIGSDDDYDTNDDEWNDLDFDSDDDWNDVTLDTKEIGVDNERYDSTPAQYQDLDDGIGNRSERNVSSARFNNDSTAATYSDVNVFSEDPPSDHESNDVDLDSNENGDYIKRKLSNAHIGDDSSAAQRNDWDVSDEEPSHHQSNDSDFDAYGSDDDIKPNGFRDADRSTDEWEDLDFNSDDEISDDEWNDVDSDDDDKSVQFTPRRKDYDDEEDSDDVVVSDLERYLYGFEDLFSKPTREAKCEMHLNDDPNDIHNAFVRHRRVNLEYIYMLEEEMEQNMSQEDNEYDDEMDDGHSDPYEKEVEVEEQDETKKEIRHKEYVSQRQVKVIKTPRELQIFCADLVESAKQSFAKHDSQESAYAVACDMEYCSLELDIRGNLPALIQLAGPSPTGPVGLIWLDKFPNHGRDLLANPDYAPLTALFADPKLLKVGVSLSYDVVNLASWCGVTEKDHRDFFFSGIVDIDEVTDENVNGKSLQEMSKLVLGRHLAKIKGKRRSERDRKHRVPTAHWRTDSMTALMKTYAVNDVSCAMDVWLKIHGLVNSKKGSKSGS